jgi:hypothetical protein
MANEIKINQSIRLVKSALKHEFTPPQLSLTMTGSLVYDVVQNVGTSEETAGPAFGDIGTEGLCVVYNLDSTNYVQVGFSTTVYGMRLYGGSAPAMFFIEPGATLYLKANTAACNVRIILYEY